MNPMLQSALLAIFRWLLTGIGSALVAKGIWGQAEATEYIAGGALALVSLVWVLWTKYKDRLLLLVGLGMPQGSTVEDAKKVAASPAVPNPPVSLPNTVPVAKISSTAVETARLQ